ncbi:MCM3 minichromosome maintenance deficient 3associated protein [Elysia marginata]|uniref:Germinal-center associated nuclear protein n=1 Tax=Elysia marginata TaxID=1093978 RepID=A0AAV4FAA6_9GAST|nr:MCM3 minichromosome maintenance deficient 3associated protein [Elysia marginata]
MAQPTETPLFGASADKSASGQGTFGTFGHSTASNTFGSFPEKSSGLGTFSETLNKNDSQGQTSTPLFGAAKSGGFETPSFGGLSNQAGTKPASFGTAFTASNVFGGQPLFGKSNPNREHTSNLFGKSFSSGGNISYDSRSSKPTPANVSLGSTPGFGMKPSTPGLFGAKSPTQSGNLFSSQISIAATTSSVFSSSQLFTSAVASRSSNASSLDVDDNDEGFRKRSSSGTMSSSILFGKKQAAKAFSSTAGTASHIKQESGHFSQISSEETPIDTGREMKLFGKETNLNVKRSSHGLFGAKPPPYSESGTIFPNTSKAGFLSGNSSGQSDLSNSKEVPAYMSSSTALFGKPTLGPGAKLENPSSKSMKNTFPVVQSSTVTPKVFGQVDPSSQNLFSDTGRKADTGLFGRDQLSETSDSGNAGLFGVGQTGSSTFGKSEPSSQTVFGGTNRGLFGKDKFAGSPKSSGSSLFGADQAQSSKLFQGQRVPESSPSSSMLPLQPVQDETSKGGSPSKRSLSKWNRSRDSLTTVQKKRIIEEEDTMNKKTSPSGLFSRSRQLSARQSLDGQNLKTSIIVKNIPVEFNKGSILRNHFSRFGTITRLQPLPTKDAANITFETHAAAKAAKDKGKEMKGCPPLSIYWRNVATKPPGSTSTAAMSRSPKGQQKPDEHHMKLQEGVQDELASMAGTFDYQEEFSPQEFRQRDNKLQKPEPKHLSSTSISASHAHTRSADRRSPTPPRKLVEDSENQGVADIENAKKLMKAIYKAKPVNATEVVAVLDARDKLLRLLQRRQSNLASAKAFIGTCEDMCYEKERYYREDIRRLALYEVIPSTLTSITGQKSKVDHARAVKEYSRSSADQEEPLPHELRPLPVLITTMNYLLSEVADEGGEGKWSEWYDFLWNRTRGIRKEITQQQLCEVEVAQLLEKCTRFHIFCSARLCEEDMMSFDPKINNENLTKCLQTVKELYADLEKRKVYCPNEAEFRAYMVLMNLNQGDTLREVQQLRPEIRESAHIYFALKAYHALNSSNYVRFFRLIKDATFLNACILHRYFNQIRGQALRIIMKAHRATGKNRVMYPVKEVIRLLGFEDSAQVESFCDHYCLTVEGDEIVMDAQAFLEPETSIPETRSQTLVEAKRIVTVGEIINGCPLPPLQLLQPSSSFDSSGTFILSAAIQEAISKGLLKMGSASVQHSKDYVSGIEDKQQLQELPATEVKSGLPNAMEVQRGRFLFSNDAIKSEVRSLILEELDKEMLVMATQILGEERHLETLVMEEVEDVISMTVQDLSRNLAEEIVKEEEAKMRQKAEEMAAQRLRVFSALIDDVVQDTVLEDARKMANEEMILVNRELHHQRLERCGAALRDDMLTTAVEAMIADVAQDVFEVDVLAKRERLAATEVCVLSLRCRRFFQIWNRKYVAQLRVKRAMLDFPSTAPNRPPKEEMEKLVPDRPHSRLSERSFYINSRTKLRLQTPMEVIQQQLYLSTHLSMASARSMLASLVLWRPLDLSHTVTPQLYKAFHDWIDEGLIEPDTAALQWKLCVSVPKKEASTTDLEMHFVKWVRAKLCRDSGRDELLKTSPSFEGEVLSLYHLNSKGEARRSVPLGICVRAFHGKWTDDQEIAAVNKSLLKGISAVLFICSTAEDLSIADSSAKASAWKKERIRLHQMLKQKPNSPGVPLVLIIPRLTGEGHLTTSELDTELQLSELRSLGLLSIVHISHIYIGAQDHPIEFFSDWSSQLSNCLRFAATHVPAPPKLWVKPVSSYVEAVVIELYKAPVYQDLRTRTRLQMLHQSPNTLISLYNEVIEHVALICASDELRNISWPAPEFDKSNVAKQGLYPTSQWNTDSHMCNLYELIVQMRLPYFRYSDMEAEDWATACRDVWAFLDKITKKDSGSTKIALFQKTAQLLIQTKKSFDQLCWLASEDGPCEPTYTNMVWTDLIDACIQYKLLSLRSGHLDIRKPDKDDDEQQDEKVEDFEEVLVYYPEDELSDFEPPASWTDALRDTEISERGQLKPAVKVAVAKRDQTLLEESTAKAKISTPNDVTVSCQAESTDDNWVVLKHRLEQERAASESFQSCLIAATAGLESPSIVSPQNFGAFVSPILPLSKETSGKSSRNNRGKQFVSSAKSNELSLLATPRRPLVRSGDSVITSTRQAQGSGAGNQDRTSSTNIEMEDMDSTEPLLEANGFSWAECSISEKVMSIQERVAAQKQEDLLFEMKLRRFMESSPLEF